MVEKLRRGHRPLAQGQSSSFARRQEFLRPPYPTISSTRDTGEDPSSCRTPRLDAGTPPVSANPFVVPRTARPPRAGAKKRSDLQGCRRETNAVRRDITGRSLPRGPSFFRKPPSKTEGGDHRPSIAPEIERRISSARTTKGKRKCAHPPPFSNPTGHNSSPDQGARGVPHRARAKKQKGTKERTSKVQPGRPGGARRGGKR